MPQTDLDLYRGGYKNRVWPANLQDYLIRRSNEGKDCCVYKGEDGQWWVAGEPLRGLSLFSDIDGINSPWELPSGCLYPAQLTLTENPDVVNDWILAPGQPMLLDTYVQLVTSIAGWIRRFLFMVENATVRLTREEISKAIRLHIERLMADSSSAADEDRTVELLNDAHLLQLVLRANETGETDPEKLKGTAGALLRDAVSAARTGSVPTIQNQITIGTVNTSNPNLWLDKGSLSGPVIVYEVSSSTPPGGRDWMAVNQFCSILAVRYLQASPWPDDFGFRNLKHPLREAETLLQMSSLDNQVKWAAGQVGGTTVTIHELHHLFEHLPAGVVFWLGNAGHAWAAIKNPSHVTLYDPDRGSADYVTMEDFLPLLDALGIDAIVMKQ